MESKDKASDAKEGVGQARWQQSSQGWGCAS